MKQPKRLTRNQKEILNSHGLNPENWMLQQETEFDLYLVHKVTKTTKIIDKCKRGKK